MRSSRGARRGQWQGETVPSNRRGGQPNGGQAKRLGGSSRQMELIASVSRSSGLEKDGDSLKERTVQEEYRTFIDSKLKTFWDAYMTSSLKNQTESLLRQKKDSQENILILFRKLREGVFASGRKDNFTLEVYETSLYLAVIFDSPVQTTSILSHLVPDMCAIYTASEPLRLVTALILLLHHLVVTFPSQKTYLEQVTHLVPNALARPSEAYAWISALARSLRTMNFVHFERLSQPEAFEHMLRRTRPTSNPKSATVFPNLARDAVCALVSRLRLKARDRAWIVVRNAYRELSSSEESQAWLGRRLLFDSFGSEMNVIRFDDWVQERCQEGHLRPKEGVEGRWMVCKARGTPGARHHMFRLQLKDSIVRKQVSYLLSLGEMELVGVDEVHGFLADVARWALVKHTSRLKEVSSKDGV